MRAPFEEGGGGIWGRHGKAFDAKRGAHTDGKNGADIGAAEDAREPVGEGKGQRGFCERSVVVGEDEGLDAAFGGEALPFFVGEWTGEDIARGEGDADARDGEPRHAEGGERPKARWSEWATERGNEGREVGEGEERDDQAEGGDVTVTTCWEAAAAGARVGNGGDLEEHPRAGGEEGVGSGRGGEGESGRGGERESGRGGERNEGGGRGA